MGTQENFLHLDPTLPTEKIPCPLCHGESYQTRYQAPSFAMVTCNRCGFCFQNPRVTESFMRAHYQEKRSRRLPPRLPLRELVPALRADKRSMEYHDSLAFATRHMTPPGRLLEIGGFHGFLLYLAKQQGWEAFGVEIAEDMAEFQREQLGVDTRAGKLEEAGFEDSFFDLIIARHLLEHVYDLNVFVQEVARILRPGGCFLVEVPNLKGFEYQFRNLRSTLALGPSAWEKMNIPQHLYCFTPDTLITLLKNHGFHPVTWETYSHRRQRSDLFYRLARLRHLLVQGTKMRCLAQKP